MPHPLLAELTFDSLPMLAAALALSAAAAAIGWRRLHLPLHAGALAMAGMLLLALAAAGVTWHRPSPQHVLVMVDLSPSTRTAAYRDRATLQRRVAQLIGSSPYRIITFAQTTAPLDPAASQLADLPAGRTVFSPPAASAVVLFSDARFQAPLLLPPTFVVVDPALEAPTDAAIADIEIRPDEAAVFTRNAGEKRLLSLSGVGGASTATAPNGGIVITRPLVDAATQIVARLAPGDAWPENDALPSFAPPPESAVRWWVGADAPDGSWRRIAPGALPTDTAAYLRPAVIVLNNIPAAELSAVQQQRLEQHVRDLGGGLLILGGEQAFAAGGYAGTVLERLSPLASTPPEPTTHWILLTDSSGSMNQPAGGSTRFRFAADAVGGVISSLPPDDLVSVGGFARGITWWARNTHAKDAAGRRLPPGSAGPRGPTDLEPALREVTGAVDPTLPKQLLLMTDGNAEVEDPDAIAAEFREKDIRLHLLLIGDDSAPAVDAMRQIVNQTGGTAIEELEPRRWAQAVRQMLQAAAPDLLVRDPVDVQFVGRLSGLPSRRVDLWSRTWLKDGSTLLALTQRGNEAPPLAALREGDDRIAAAAFQPNSAELTALVDLVERPPRDPRFSATWHTGSRLRVTVDAVDGETYLNGEQLEFQMLPLTSGGTAAAPIVLPQTGPGRYELEIDAPTSPALATLTHAARVIARRALPGRYPAEFEEIGNDRNAMQDLAARSGGAVIEPDDTRPIDLPHPRRPVSLTSPLAALGALLIALSLITWRLRGG